MSKTSKKEVSGEAMKESEVNEDVTETKSPKNAKSSKKTDDDPVAVVAADADEKLETQAETQEADDAGETETDPVEALKDELAAERDKYLRLAAEYDNYRKRSAKERETVYSDARTDTITRLLPVYDNLERALKMECADEPFFKGVEMTMTQLTEILEGMAVTQIPAVGEPFDPNLHNAVMTIENPELGEKVIAEECQKGFLLGDKVIRFSTVVVAN